MSDFWRIFYFPSKIQELCNTRFLRLQCFLLKKVSCHPITWLDSVHPILLIAPTISIPMIILAYGQRLDQWHVILMDRFSSIVFHLSGFPIIRSLSGIIGWSAGAIGLAGFVGIVGIQRSSQILISLSECNFCLIPNVINGFTAIILFHQYEGLFTSFSRNGELHRKYCPLRTLASKELGNCTNRHNGFPSNARLN